MTHDEWMALCMDALVESLEVCMCGAAIAPDEPICEECGCGELWVDGDGVDVNAESKTDNT